MNDEPRITKYWDDAKTIIQYQEWVKEGCFKKDHNPNSMKR